MQEKYIRKIEETLSLLKKNIFLGQKLNPNIVEKKNNNEEKDKKSDKGENDQDREKDGKKKTVKQKENDIKKKRKMVKIPATLKQLMNDDRGLQKKFLKTTIGKDKKSERRDW